MIRCVNKIVMYKKQFRLVIGLKGLSFFAYIALYLGAIYGSLTMSSFGPFKFFLKRAKPGLFLFIFIIFT